MEFETPESIRKALIERYPDVNNDEFSIQHSGFVHDHPMIPIGVVLISAVVLGTTDPLKLAEFTNYSERFVRVIAVNMTNCQIWKDNEYDCSSWSSGSVMPSNRQEDDAFWEHIEIADGPTWHTGTDRALTQDACFIFWEDMLAEAKAHGIMLWRSGKRVL